MRYTKIALLTFGAGIVLGLVVVVVAADALDRVASGMMALGLFAIPVAMVADWLLAAKSVKRPVKKRKKTPVRRGAPASGRRTPRPRKAVPPKR